MSMAKSSSPASKTFNWTNTIIASIVAILVLGVAFLQFLYSSQISGTEFCPQNFQYREFSYRRIPGTKIRISTTSLGTARSEAPTDILKHLTATGALVWQPMKVGDVSFPPDILKNYLGQRNADSVSAWGAWSADNSLMAAELWPVVQRAAINELYIAIPDLMRIAQSDHTPASLRTELNESVMRSLIDRCRVEPAASGSEAAKATMGWVIAWADEIKTQSPTEEVLKRYKELRELTSESNIDSSSKE